MNGNGLEYCSGNPKKAVQKVGRVPIPRNEGEKRDTSILLNSVGFLAPLCGAAERRPTGNEASGAACEAPSSQEVLL